MSADLVALSSDRVALCLLESCHDYLIALRLLIESHCVFSGRVVSDLVGLSSDLVALCLVESYYDYLIALSRLTEPH